MAGVGGDDNLVEGSGTSEVEGYRKKMKAGQWRGGGDGRLAEGSGSSEMEDWGGGGVCLQSPRPTWHCSPRSQLGPGGQTRNGDKVGTSPGKGSQEDTALLILAPPTALFCDYYNPEGQCEWHYQPCGAPCMRTCQNPSGHCLHDLPGLEGEHPFDMFDMFDMASKKQWVWLPFCGR